MNASDRRRIHVHTQSDRSTTDYASFMWSTMRSLANHVESLQLTVHCLGTVASERLAALPDAQTIVVPNVVAGTALVGSMGHGACVEHALAMTGDASIHIIVDSDTVVLARGWDDYVRQRIGAGIGAMGATYENMGGITSGAGTVQTYKGVPNAVWIALSPEHCWQRLRALPRKETNLRIDSEALSRTYGLPLGYQLLCDVAWQLPAYLEQNAIAYDGWRQRKPSGDALVLKGLNDYHEEYHVQAGSMSVPFVAHHRGSMRYAYRGDKLSRAFYAAIDGWLQRELERAPRWVDDRCVQRDDDTCQIELVANPTFEPHDAWLKVTLNKVVIHPRGPNAPVRLPELDVVGFLRVEGTVTSPCIIVDVARAPNQLTVRNMAAGPCTLKAPDGSRSVSIPSDECWTVLVDVDGPVVVAAAPAGCLAR